MPITSLVTLLLVIGALVGIRAVLFKVFKPNAELPVETTTGQSTGELLEPVSMWPIVVLLGVIVGLVVVLMVFGNVING